MVILVMCVWPSVNVHFAHTGFRGCSSHRTPVQAVPPSLRLDPTTIWHSPLWGLLLLHSSRSYEVYRDAFEAGVWFADDPGPFLGCAIIYKLQGRLHRDMHNIGPSVSFPVDQFTGGEMGFPQLNVKLQWVSWAMSYCNLIPMVPDMLQATFVFSFQVKSIMLWHLSPQQPRRPSKQDRMWLLAVCIRKTSNVPLYTMFHYES